MARGRGPGKLCFDVFCDAGVDTARKGTIGAAHEATRGADDEGSSHQSALIRRALREGNPVASSQDAHPFSLATIKRSLSPAVRHPAGP